MVVMVTMVVMVVVVVVVIVVKIVYKPAHWWVTLGTPTRLALSQQNLYVHGT